MDQAEQISAFAGELSAHVNRYAREFQLSSPAAVGVLLMQIRIIQDEDLKIYEN